MKTVSTIFKDAGGGVPLIDYYMHKYHIVLMNFSIAQGGSWILSLP